MTDLELFNSAVYWAQTRRSYRQHAEKGHPRLTRRMCLLRARRAEAVIVDLAIRAERSPARGQQ